MSEDPCAVNSLCKQSWTCGLALRGGGNGSVRGGGRVEMFSLENQNHKTETEDRASVAKHFDLTRYLAHLSSDVPKVDLFQIWRNLKLLH